MEFYKPANRSARVPVVDIRTIEAPVMGMNTEQKVHRLKATEAVFIVDGTCKHYGVETRGGTELIAGQEATIPNINPKGIPHIFASTLDESVFIDTLDGMVYASNAAVLFADPHESPYISTQTSVAGTSFIYFCREGAAPRLFDSNTVYVMTDVSVPYALLGVPTEELNFCFTFKRRIWFTRIFSSNLYYLDTDAIAGTLVEFPLGPQMKRGGRPFAIASWSSDSGQGLDDYFIVLTTQGELIVYQGTDPSAAETWKLVGNFFVGEPFRTPYCLQKTGGDLLILTKKGLFSFAGLLNGRPPDASNSLTQKIQTLFSVLSARSVGQTETPGIPASTLVTAAGDYLITEGGDYLVWEFGDGLPARGNQKLHFSEAESLLLIHFYFATGAVPYITLVYSMETKGWSIWKNLSVSGFVDFRGQLCGPTDSRFLNVYSRKGLVAVSPAGINLPELLIVTAPQNLGTKSYKSVSLIKPTFQNGLPWAPTTPSLDANLTLTLLADFRGQVGTTVQGDVNDNFVLGGPLPDYFNLLTPVLPLEADGVLVRSQFSEDWISIASVHGQHFTLVIQDKSLIQNPTTYINNVFQSCEVLVGPGSVA